SLADHAAQTLQCVVQLTGHDPHLVGVAASDRRQHLHVLVSKQRLVRLTCMNGAEDGSDRLGLALGAEHLSLPAGLGSKYGGLAVALCPENGGLLLTAGGQNLRLPLPLGQQDRCPLVPPCPHPLSLRLPASGGGV